MSWNEIRKELLRRKAAGEPVETLVYRVSNWIDEVGDEYVVVRSERTDNQRTITALQIELCEAPNRRIKLALRALGDC
jgi:hypothetical protein